MFRILSITLAMFTGTSLLKLKDIAGPSKVMVGSTATLTCVLDLGEDDVLQSLKWYKDGTEFCSYRPSIGNEGISHRTLFDVEDLKCGNSSVRFGPVSVSASGNYKCEASVSAALAAKYVNPSVQRVMGSKNLSVFAYPMQAPLINGVKTHYHSGEYIEAQCVAPLSYPAPEMLWTIDGKAVDSHKTHMTVIEEEGLLRATISLKMLADKVFMNNPGTYALLVCTSMLMDTPPLSSEVKAYWSTLDQGLQKDSDQRDELKELRNSQGRTESLYLVSFCLSALWLSIMFATFAT